MTTLYKKLSVIIVIFIFFCLLSFIEGNADDNAMDKEIVINIPSRTLSYYEGGELQKSYPIAVGKAATKTPVGSYSVISKLINPYYSKMKIPGGSPNNPLGIRWIGFRTNYGIHGNSAPGSIGTTASAGCVRMYNYDVKELYEKVDYKTRVKVTYEIFKAIHTQNDALKGLIIYPDVYKTERNIKKSINEQLLSLNMLESIGEDRVTEAAKEINRKTVVLSNNWAVIINDNYISTDTYYDGEKIYISEEIVEKYFGLIIDKSMSMSWTIHNMDIHYQQIGEKYYVPVKSIVEILGAEYKTNNITLNAWINIPLIKLNGVYLDTNTYNMAAHEVMVPINKIFSIYDNKEFINSAIKVLNNVQYIELSKLQKTHNLTYNVHSLDRRIELYSIPAVLVEDRQIPVYGDVNNIMIDYSNLLIDNRDQKLVNIYDLEEIFEIEQDFYRTKIILRSKQI